MTLSSIEICAPPKTPDPTLLSDHSDHFFSHTLEKIKEYAPLIFLIAFTTLGVGTLGLVIISSIASTVFGKCSKS